MEEQTAPIVNDLRIVSIIQGAAALRWYRSVPLSRDPRWISSPPVYADRPRQYKEHPGGRGKLNVPNLDG